MSPEEFAHNVDSSTADAAPAELEPLLSAMWHARRGNWERAHEIAQGVETEQGSLVHAYLHRVEGDAGNARYWYTRAKRPVFPGPLEEEWTVIVEELLQD